MISTLRDPFFWVTMLAGVFGIALYTFAIAPLVGHSDIAIPAFPDRAFGFCVGVFVAWYAQR